MALALDDYKNAKRILDILQQNYGRSKAVAAVAVAIQYDEHHQGRVDNWFSFNNSYKLLQTTEWNTTAEQYIGGNYRLMAGIGSTRLDDFAANAHQVINSKIVAVEYNDLWQKTELRMIRIIMGRRLALLILVLSVR